MIFAVMNLQSGKVIFQSLTAIYKKHSQLLVALNIPV